MIQITVLILYGNHNLLQHAPIVLIYVFLTFFSLRPMETFIWINLILNKNLICLSDSIIMISKIVIYFLLSFSQERENGRLMNNIKKCHIEKRLCEKIKNSILHPQQLSSQEWKGFIHISHIIYLCMLQRVTFIRLLCYTYMLYNMKIGFLILKCICNNYRALLMIPKPSSFFNFCTHLFSWTIYPFQVYFCVRWKWPLKAFFKLVVN